MSARQLQELHMDPPGPMPGAGDGFLLDTLDAEALDALVAAAGPGSGSPLVSVELRHLGGALTDWFTFGFGLARSSYGSDRLVTESSAYLFHIEAFPLFARGGIWRDIALFADFGTGSATIKRRDDGVQHAASGALSIVGLGSHWEAWRLAGHVALGPYVAWHYEDSNSMARTFGEIGFRGAFYGGP